MPLEKNTYRSIKIQTGTSIDVEKFIKDCIYEYKETENGNGLLNTDDKYFWSESLLKRMVKMEEVSAKRKKAGKKGAKERWGKNQEAENDNSKRQIKGFTKKYNKCIANAIKNNSKSIANVKKSIAKNSKIKSKSKSKIKNKIIDLRSIYPSDHKKEEPKKMQMDEIEEMEFQRIINYCELHILDPALAIEIKEILRELYLDPRTRGKAEGLNSKKILYALQNFSVANTKTKIQKPKEYFKKCVLSAADQTELSLQYDTDTIYEIGGL